MDHTLRTVLVTGAAGFIGSHTCVELLSRGHRVVAIDDYSNSSPVALCRAEQLGGRPLQAIAELDVRDQPALTELMARFGVDAVIHFAAHKAVGESVRHPWKYYDLNLRGLLSVLGAMRATGVARLVFSSSCSIYGANDGEPLREDSTQVPASPYARSKQMSEQILADACTELPLGVLALRYFNPAGAHPSGLLGEDPRGVPNNLMPLLAQAAVGRHPEVRILGGDYPTADGTCVRDYVHVVDVAVGHRIALEQLDGATGFDAVNLGTGTGASVRELVRCFEEVSGQSIPVRVVDRRPGDAPVLVADPGQARRRWGWTARFDLATMCRHAWEFQRRHPAGYATARAVPEEAR